MTALDATGRPRKVYAGVRAFDAYFRRLHGFRRPIRPTNDFRLKGELGEYVAPSDDYVTPEERDDATIEAGMRPELMVAFPRGAYRVVIGKAGLSAQLPSTTNPSAIEGAHPETQAFDTLANEILCQVETRLRPLARRKGLQRLSGGSWIKRRAHPDVLSGWRERQAVGAGREGRAGVYAEIYYADLMDLRL